MELASIAYGRRVILYTISQDGYLQEQLVTSCTGTLEIMEEKKQSHPSCWPEFQNVTFVFRAN
jgi:hypothetical protein